MTANFGANSREEKSVRFSQGPRINVNELEEDLRVMRENMFRKAYSDVKNGFEEELGAFKKDLLDKNRLLAMEIENLKDRASGLATEKNKNEQELLNLNREILLKKERDDEQLRRLYIALDRTNPEKFQKREFNEMVPFDLMDTSKQGAFEKPEIV